MVDAAGSSRMAERRVGELEKGHDDRVRSHCFEGLEREVRMAVKEALRSGQSGASAAGKIRGRRDTVRLQERSGLPQGQFPKGASHAWCAP